MVELPKQLPSTVNAIYKAHEAKNSSWDNLGLAVGQLGKECERALWYEFRWAPEKIPFDGRMLRLFETGHLEEVRMIEGLRMVEGVTVDDGYVDAFGKQKQHAVSAVAGHLRGKMDGRVTGVLEAPKTVHILEVKTHNDKSFKKTFKEGVQKSKPEHYCQFQIYCHLDGKERAFYFYKNKNDDTLESERLPYDPAYCMRAIVKAERIIYSPRPLPRLHEDPDAKMAWACNYCNAKPICHYRAWPRVNCRTCLHSTPVDSGEAVWRCDRWEREISYKEQQVGCKAHLFIPDLVPGKQVDADPDARTVTYELPDGEWVNAELEGACPPVVPERAAKVTKPEPRYFHHPGLEALKTEDGSQPEGSVELTYEEYLECLAYYSQ